MAIGRLSGHIRLPDLKQSSLMQELAENPGNWTPTSQWGDVGYEATGDFFGAAAYAGAFARNGWTVRSFSCWAMRIVARISAGLFVLAATALLPSGASAAEPALADLCTVMPVDATVSNNLPGRCMASAPSNRSGVLLSIILQVSGPWPDSDAALQQELDNIIPVAAQVPTSAFGDEAYEGSDGTGNLSVYDAVFRRGAYLVTVYGWPEDGATVHAYALAIDANLRVALAGSSLAPSPAPSASPATLELGLGCATDLTFVRCTTSVFGAADDAQLSYEWRFDGQTRPDTGSTMEIDWVAEGVPAGHHSVGVTVTDTRHNLSGTNSTGFDLGLAVTLSCSYSGGGGDYTVSCTASPVTAGSTANLTYEWSYVHLDSSGTQRSGQGSSTGETFSRSFGRGAVSVTVTVRDSATGGQSSPATDYLIIDPQATLTEILTLGHTADPQNVIDTLQGLFGGLIGAGIGVGVGTAIGSGKPSPSRGSTPPTTGKTVVPGPAAAGTSSTGPPPADDPFGAAAEVLAAQAGQLPPLTSENFAQWKALTGWPSGPAADAAFLRGVWALTEQGAKPEQIFNYLRDNAARVRASRR